MTQGLIPLTEMRRGQSGVVRELHGGSEFAQKLASLGVRIGQGLTKVSSMVLNGPVVISIHKRHIAIGFGMARRIVVEIK